MVRDRSNGYEAIADQYRSVRDGRVGVDTVLTWASTLAPGGSVLDLGCGNGVPISEALIQRGFRLCGVDASATMVREFRAWFPHSPVECAAVEDSDFLCRSYDGVVAWGLMFLLEAEVQAMVIKKVGTALGPSGQFLFTAPKETATWRDALTGALSLSLGVTEYERLLEAAGFRVSGSRVDGAGNHSYCASKI